MNNENPCLTKGTRDMLRATAVQPNSSSRRMLDLIKRLADRLESVNGPFGSDSVNDLVDEARQLQREFE